MAGAEPTTAVPVSPADEARIPQITGRSLTVLGAGDILVHPEMWDQARRDGGGRMDFAPMLSDAAGAVSGAGLALCHMETPVAPLGGPFIGFPKFSVPPQIVDGIKATGYDGCSTASNHAIDRGPEGVTRTLDALDAAGIGHTGTYRTAAESRLPTIYPVDGVKIAHLSYTKHFNGLTEPAGLGWIANEIDPKKIASDAKQARRAGAEIVIVSMHWGTEYEHEPDVDQQNWARQVAASPDVDVIFGHHAHVVQPIEQVSGKWVVYGMGNQIARHAEPINENREGAMVRFTFTPAGPQRWKVALVEALPTFVDLNPDIRLVDLAQALRSPGLSPGRRRIYEAAMERIGGHLLTRAAGSERLFVHGFRSPA
ncbi:poly-gamma-glutamate biosynthesis protein [Catellatospora sp. IY07-71]|nr:poly-gamma-glutamate biosynthesis protein [Catellatospora sp. IY07-71]